MLCATCIPVFTVEDSTLPDAQNIKRATPFVKGCGSFNVLPVEEQAATVASSGRSTASCCLLSTLKQLGKSTVTNTTTHPVR